MTSSFAKCMVPRCSTSVPWCTPSTGASSSVSRSTSSTVNPWTPRQGSGRWILCWCRLSELTEEWLVGRVAESLRRSRPGTQQWSPPDPAKLRREAHARGTADRAREPVTDVCGSPITTLSDCVRGMHLAKATITRKESDDTGRLNTHPTAAKEQDCRRTLE